MYFFLYMNPIKILVFYFFIQFNLVFYFFILFGATIYGCLRRTCRGRLIKVKITSHADLSRRGFPLIQGLHCLAYYLTIGRTMGSFILLRFIVGPWRFSLALTLLVQSTRLAGKTIVSFIIAKLVSYAFSGTI